MRQKGILFLLVFLLALVIGGCGSSSTDLPSSSQQAEEASQTETNSPQPEQNEGILKVHFLDVGQADSIFIQFPNQQTMLIDAGDEEDGPTVVGYLEKQGVQKIDYLVATHPHKDHIGGIDDVIDQFPIGKVYMPDVKTTTDSFRDFLLAMKNHDLKAYRPASDNTFLQGDQLQGTFIVPFDRTYEALNDNSIVTRIEYGNTAFLFMGDAEAQFESSYYLSSQYINLKADVIKISHHGSSDGTSASLLQIVDPKYAVISVGANNDYNHPHKTVLDRLERAGVKVYRTDLDGTVIFSSDGDRITAATNNKTEVLPLAKSDSVGKEQVLAVPANAGYIGNINSKKLHRVDCSSLPAEKNRVYFSSREEAIRQGYEPSKECNP